MKRDKSINKELKEKKWNVIRLWEHELRNDEYKKKIEKIKKNVQRIRIDRESAAIHDLIL